METTQVKKKHHMPQSFNCPSCGAPLESKAEAATIICIYCGESVVVHDDLRDHPLSNPIEKIRSESPPKSSIFAPFWSINSMVRMWIIISIASVVLPILLTILFTIVVGVFPLLVGLIAVFAGLILSHIKW